MSRTNELVTKGHRLRDTQILAVLVYLDSDTNMGKLCQIHTGEGKTVIVSLLASIKLLLGEKTIDIITSNPVLALESVKNRTMFYNILGFSVSCNNFSEGYISGARACYSSDIVYGSIGNFQFDYLRDTFEGLGTRGTRDFECVILDEVDSMLVDNGSHIAKLSGPFPGMESLRYIYIKIWQELFKAEGELIKELQQELQQLSDNDEENLENYSNRLNESAMERIKAKIKASRPHDIKLIPKHLKKYAEQMIDKWIENAVYAKYFCDENVQYILKKDDKNNELSVVPVDFANTGVSLKNTIWSFGLHQFLQLKHNLQLTSESLTTSFISNLGYIKKYGNKIYGLTGTLGSQSEQDLLSSIYNLDYAKIPTFKQKHFEEIEGIVVEDSKWAVEILVKIMSFIDQKRAALVILETKRDLNELKSLFELSKEFEENAYFRIKTFSDEDESNIVDELVCPGDIILATNLAGRGTDLKTSDDLENNGGLHVCVGFLPINKRVEDQAFGRTSRQGKRGTAQLILRLSEVEKLLEPFVDELDFEIGFNDLKLLRDYEEKNRIEYIKNKEIRKLQFQDYIFSKFSHLYGQLSISTSSDLSYFYVLNDLKEFWAFWLEKKDFNGTEDVNEAYETFLADSVEIRRGTIKHNPYYYIQQAEHYLRNNFIKQARESIDRALNMEDSCHFLHSAYLKLFEVEIESGSVLMNRFKKAIGDLFFVNVTINNDYKAKGRENLLKAKEAITVEIDYIQKLFEDEKFKNIILPADTPSSEKENILVSSLFF